GATGLRITVKRRRSRIARIPSRVVSEESPSVELTTVTSWPRFARRWLTSAKTRSTPPTWARWERISTGRGSKGLTRVTRMLPSGPRDGAAHDRGSGAVGGAEADLGPVGDEEALRPVAPVLFGEHDPAADVDVRLDG